MRDCHEDHGEIYLVVPADARNLRALRLVAADAGGRAGLDASEVDDLRIAVDELCQTVMDATHHRLVVRIVVHGSQVIVRASARRRANDPAPRLSTISELIVDAVTEHYRLDHSDTEVSFVVTKTAGRMGAA
jgi:anti-sigma regulatory factor (Ser/Thr protein kinase)